ncbi:MAG: 3-hydroxyacyl-ACP dehydratase FabZ [Alphaproteobacteria bacterium]|nr:3-hydroxyacyl-ACP dehydratase FabZ [Alphaproteobacteria bacterium]MBO4643984.1 3-hydroxyacyl-ACP dehydratase FabZ [Alphaproteobacteria bacterium]
MEENKIIEVGTNEILKLLPHRYPFLLVDKVSIIKEKQEGIGLKNVTANEPQFTGHFPENPVMPGVLIVEAMAQTAAVIEMYGKPDDVKKGCFFMSLESVKFRKPVVPGDQLKMHLTLEQARRNVYRFRGEATVGDVLCTEAMLTAMIFDEK